MPRARWEALARKRAKRGRKTMRMDNAPDLFADLRYGWDAWRELDMAREYAPGGTPLGVRHTEVVAWLNLNLIRDDLTRLDIYGTVFILDATWLSEERKARKKPTKNGNSKGRARGSRVRVGGKARR